MSGNCAEQAEAALLNWISWTRRCHLALFKRFAKTLTERLPGVVRGTLDGRSNAYVEAMNGLLQQTKTAARRFRTMTDFVAIAYFMAKLKHLPQSPLRPAVPLGHGVTFVAGVKFHTERPLFLANRF